MPLEDIPRPASAAPESAETPTSVLQEPAMQKFIAARNVPPELFPIIEELCTIPKDLVIREMHNFYSNTGWPGDKALPALERFQQDSKDPIKARMFELFAEFTRATDVYAAQHLEIILEWRT